MAQESANITLTLTDEMSDKLNTISQNLDNLRQKMIASSRESAEPLRRIREDYEKIHESTSKVGTGLQFLGGFSKSALIEFSSNLGKTAEKMHGLSSMTGTLMTSTASLARVLTGVAGTMSTIATLGVTVGGGMVLLGSAMTKAWQTAENLRRSLGDGAFGVTG